MVYKYVRKPISDVEMKRIWRKGYRKPI